MTKPPQHCAGIDYSMTCPSITLINPAMEFKFKNTFVFFMDKRKKYSKKFGKNIIGTQLPGGENDIHRYDQISEWAIKILNKFNVTKVALEGYSYGSKGSRVFNIAENTMSLKTKMFNSGIEFIVPSPSQLKKYWTGSGNSGKTEMVLEFITRTNEHLHVAMDTSQMESKPIEDIVDSYAACNFMYDQITGSNHAKS